MGVNSGNSEIHRLENLAKPPGNGSTYPLGFVAMVRRGALHRRAPALAGRRQAGGTDAALADPTLADLLKTKPYLGS
jgi:hypothetical protein